MSKGSGAKPKTQMKLVLTCFECATQVRALFVDDQIHARTLFRETGWVLSLIDPSEACVAPICPGCARMLYGEEMLETVRKKFDADETD